MLEIREPKDFKEIYDYQMGMTFPYRFSVNYDIWKESFLEDTDGEGRTLFTDLYIKEAYEDDQMVGFIQYGKSAFGFDESGEISADVTYPIIRMLYFDQNHEEAGRLLLKEAMDELEAAHRVYAFFHYFGMNCFARHGKLFETYT